MTAEPDRARFTPDSVLQRLARFPRPDKYWVGLSGGADSTALLVALHAIRDRLPGALHAVHFNHGLQADADAWQAACERLCAERSVSLEVIRFQLDVRAGQSPEVQARTARYEAMASRLDVGDIYLTAHHADDNAETMLLHLMRGSGVDGMAGIPPIRKVGKGWVARPLLEFRRRELEAFLDGLGIRWQQDFSNMDVNLDRGFLRTQVIPLLSQRWPSAVPRLFHSATLARENLAVLAQLLERQYGDMLRDPFVMNLATLLELGPDLQSAVLRHWMRLQDIVPPPGRKLAEFLAQLNASGSRIPPNGDGSRSGTSTRAELRWNRHLLKVHLDRLWLHELPSPGPCPSLDWNEGSTLDLGTRLGELVLHGSSRPVPRGWRVGPRENGSGIQLRDGGPRRGLKGKLRELRVPPWLRESIPVLYWHDEPVWVGGLLVSPRLKRFLDEQQAQLEWRPTLPLLQKLQSVSVQFLSRTMDSHG